MDIGEMDAPERSEWKPNPGPDLLLCYKTIQTVYISCYKQKPLKT